jgi:acetyl-CoA decarbonylase/synthase complex subunit delta
MMPPVTEKWTGKIEEVVIGATKDEDGTRGSKIIIGGQSTLPFLYFDGKVPNLPVIGMEVYDIDPEFPDMVREHFGSVLKNAGEWAKYNVEKCGADFICLKLKGTDPDGADLSVDDAVKVIETVFASVDVPIFVYGSGAEEKDSQIFQACGDLLKRERCAIGRADGEKYKSISVASMAYDQTLIAFSNLDINLAKQLNILLIEFGVKKNKIIMDPLQAGLGYGLDYSYSVIERIRLAALQGDTMLQMPIICDTSLAWNARESTEVNPDLGDVNLRGTIWESVTGISAIMAGADLLIMRYPPAVKIVRDTINMMRSGD